MVYLYTIYRVLGRSYVCYSYSLNFFEVQLLDISAFVKLFCSSFLDVPRRLLESSDTLPWDLKALYQYHSWSGTLNYTSTSPLTHIMSKQLPSTVALRLPHVHPHRLGWWGFLQVCIVHSIFLVHSDLWNQNGILLPSTLSPSVQSLCHLSTINWLR